MAIGVGMAISNSKAVIEALLGKESPFERTPKFGVQTTSQKKDWEKRSKSFVRKGVPLATLEVAHGVYVLLCIAFCIKSASVLNFSLPFLLVFASGYFYVGILSFRGIFQSAEQREKKIPMLESATAA